MLMRAPSAVVQHTGRVAQVAGSRVPVRQPTYPAATT
jgi:hypothetical protein